MGIPINKIEEHYFDKFSFTMKDYNSTLIVVGDYLNITVIVCFETSLIDKIVKSFMKISEIDENAREELYLDASGEVMNIVVGLANPQYIKKGENITMSPPSKISDINDIELFEKYTVLKANIYTEFGNMDISIIESRKSEAR